MAEMPWADMPSAVFTPEHAMLREQVRRYSTPWVWTNL